MSEEKCPKCGADQLSREDDAAFKCGSWLEPPNWEECRQSEYCQLKCAERRIAELEGAVRVFASGESYRINSIGDVNGPNFQLQSIALKALEGK